MSYGRPLNLCSNDFFSKAPIYSKFVEKPTSCFPAERITVHSSTYFLVLYFQLIKLVDYLMTLIPTGITAESCLHDTEKRFNKVVIGP